MAKKNNNTSRVGTSTGGKTKAVNTLTDSDLTELVEGLYLQEGIDLIMSKNIRPDRAYNIIHSLKVYPDDKDLRNKVLNDLNTDPYFQLPSKVKNSDNNSSIRERFKNFVSNIFSNEGVSDGTTGNQRTVNSTSNDELLPPVRSSEGSLTGIPNYNDSGEEVSGYEMIPVDGGYEFNPVGREVNTTPNTTPDTTSLVESIDNNTRNPELIGDRRKEFIARSYEYFDSLEDDNLYSEQPVTDFQESLGRRLDRNEEELFNTILRGETARRGAIRDYNDSKSKQESNRPSIEERSTLDRIQDTLSVMDSNKPKENLTQDNLTHPKEAVSEPVNRSFSNLSPEERSNLGSLVSSFTPEGLNEDLIPLDTRGRVSAPGEADSQDESISPNVGEPDGIDDGVITTNRQREGLIDSAVGLAPFVPNFVNAFRRTPPMPSPRLDPHMTPNYINLDASRQEAVRSQRGANEGIRESLSSGATAAAAEAGNLVSTVRNINEITEREAVHNNQVSNQIQAQNNQISMNNNAKLDAFDRESVAARIQEDNLRSQNIANLANNIQLAGREKNLRENELTNILLTVANDDTGASWGAVRDIIKDRFPEDTFAEIDKYLTETAQMNKADRVRMIEELIANGITTREGQPAVGGSNKNIRRPRENSTPLNDYYNNRD